jgi:hypothetical protein
MAAKPPLTLGAMIATARKAKPWSPQQLGDAVGMVRQGGKAVSPQFIHLKWMWHMTNVNRQRNCSTRSRKPCICISTSYTVRPERVRLSSTPIRRRTRGRGQRSLAFFGGSKRRSLATGRNSSRSSRRDEVRTRLVAGYALTVTRAR